MEVTRTQAWILATRPRTLSAAAAPVVAGSGFAAADGVFALNPALAALLGALFIQVATNLANDYYDFVKGGDTAERLGPVRVTQAGILPPEAVLSGMLIALGLATLTGIYLASVAGWPVIAIGLVSMLMGVCYTGGPYPLSYHGLGDVFVFVFFGPVATATTYYVQAQGVVAGRDPGGGGARCLQHGDAGGEQPARPRDRRCRGQAYPGRAVWGWLLGCSVLRVPHGGGRRARCRGGHDGVVPWTLLSLAGWLPCIPVVRRVLAVLQTPGTVDRRSLNPALAMTARGVAVYGAGLGVGALLGAMGPFG